MQRERKSHGCNLVGGMRWSRTKLLHLEMAMVHGMGKNLYPAVPIPAYPRVKYTWGACTFPYHSRTSNNQASMSWMAWTPYPSPAHTPRAAGTWFLDSGAMAGSAKQLLVYCGWMIPRLEKFGWLLDMHSTAESNWPGLRFQQKAWLRTSVFSLGSVFFSMNFFSSTK